MSSLVRTPPFFFRLFPPHVMKMFIAVFALWRRFSLFESFFPAAFLFFTPSPFVQTSHSCRTGPFLFRLNPPRFIPVFFRLMALFFPASGRKTVFYSMDVTPMQRPPRSWPPVFLLTRCALPSLIEVPPFRSSNPPPCPFNIDPPRFLSSPPTTQPFSERNIFSINRLLHERWFLFLNHSLKFT